MGVAGEWLSCRIEGLKWNDLCYYRRLGVEIHRKSSCIYVLTVDRKESHPPLINSINPLNAK